MILITGDPITGGIPLSVPFFIYTTNKRCITLDSLGPNPREVIRGDLVIDVPGKKLIFRQLTDPDSCRAILENALTQLLAKNNNRQAEPKTIHFDINQFDPDWIMDNFDIIPGN